MRGSTVGSIFATLNRGAGGSASAENPARGAKRAKHGKSTK